jgi:hypothetical protein
MNTDPLKDDVVNADPTGEPLQDSERERREAIEAELSRISSTDLMVQATVSLLNIAGHRLGKTVRSTTGEQGASDAAAQSGADVEGDLEQVRDAIDAVRALLGILERRMSSELGPLRDALSQLQIAYAREVRVQAPADSSGAPGGGGEPSARDAGDGASPPAGAPGGRQREDEPAGQKDAPAGGRAPGPAESSGRLWVPGR